MDNIGKWAPGPGYGPVLSPIDLYMLNQPLQLHPVLAGTDPTFHLILNFHKGEVGGYDDSSGQQRDLSLDAHRRSPATRPRVQQLHIVTRIAPWCTTVKNDKGVTVGDVVDTLFREYATKTVTDYEWNKLPQRLQQSIMRIAQQHFPEIPPEVLNAVSGSRRDNAPVRRADWLKDKYFFDSLERDDAFCQGKLGYSGPDVFVLNLTN